ncbi:MAG: hypothetical protein IPM13_07220 [Phycisphaerales bacterium]|nr:hypothetical protein [Phycisphaerales bacterium]
MRATSLSLALVLYLLVTTASGDLLITDRYRDSVHKFSSVDGSVIQLDFINTASGLQLDSALEALVVGDEIWVADQNLDMVARYTLAGVYLGPFIGPSSQIDNIRGIHVHENVLYVTNFGSANGAPGGCIRKFDATTGANLGSVFPPGVRSPWDVMVYQGRILVSDDLNISTNPLLDTAAIFELLPGGGTGVFASGSQGTNGLSLPKQMIELANGNLLVGNNGLPRALIEFNAAGQIVASYSTGSLRTNGLFELDNGLILVAGEDTGVLGTNGIYTLNRSNGAFTPLLLGNQTPGGLLPHYINFIPSAPAVCPGDCDCDGDVDFDDIDFFVAALGGEQAWADFYASVYGGQPPCSYENCDVDGVGGVTFDDIDPFVARIGLGCP